MPSDLDEIEIDLDGRDYLVGLFPPKV